MQRIKKIISSNIQGKKVLFLFILTNLVYAVMLLVTIPKTMSFSNGIKVLDMMSSGYSFEYISELFNALGEKGRDVYLLNQIPVDMVYPLLFGISYCLLIAFFLNKLNYLKKPFFYLCLLPLAGLADYLENIGIISMLTSYPNISPTIASGTNLFTIVKSMATTFYFVSLLTTLLILGLTKLRKKQPTH